MLGNLIKDYCKTNKISQDEFGIKIGSSGRFVRYLITGSKEPSVECARKLTKILKCSLDDIYSKKK